MTLRVNNGSYKICYLPFYWLVYDQKNSAWSKSSAPSLLLSVPIRLWTSPIIHSSSFILSMYLLFPDKTVSSREAGAICILLTTVFLSLVSHNASHMASAQKYMHDKWMCEWLSQNVSKLKGPSSQLSPLSLGPNYWHDYDILNSHFQYSQK